MTAYIARRLLLMIPTLFGVMVINFFIVQLAPGGPVESDLVTFGDDLTGTAFVSVNPVASGMAPGMPPLITFGGVDTADIALLDPLFVDGLGYDLGRVSIPTSWPWTARWPRRSPARWR